MLNKLPKFNRKAADSEILKTYEDLRNERWRQWLYYGLPIVMTICVLSIGLLMVLEDHTIRMLVLLLDIALIFGWFLILAALSPHGTRRTAFTVVIGWFVLCAVLAWVANLP